MSDRHFASVLAELKRRGLDAEFEAIAKKHSMLLSEVMGRSKRYCMARGECYALLASRGWSLRRIRDLFGWGDPTRIGKVLRLHEQRLAASLLQELRGLRKCGAA